MTTKTAHTPGPWRIAREVDSVDRLVYITISAGRRDISTTGVYGRKPDGKTSGKPYIDRFGTERHPPHISADECRANARLIAAAPELLAALRECLTIVCVQNGNLHDDINQIVERATAAIAAAEGE